MAMTRRPVPLVRERRGGPGLHPLTAEQRRRIEQCLKRLPYYRPALEILAGEGLRPRGNKLVAGGKTASQMHAASFLTRGKIVLDRALLGRGRELARILYHEVFHFVWPRLGNPLRLSYEEVLRWERQQGAQGELGWSAEVRKLALTSGPTRRRSRQWAEYVCESFCDSAAWFCLGGRPEHPEWTLKSRFRRRRLRWFLAADLLPRLQL